jgi:hypothetical protein
LVVVVVVVVVVVELGERGQGHLYLEGRANWRVGLNGCQTEGGFSPIKGL